MVLINKNNSLEKCSNLFYYRVFILPPYVGLTASLGSYNTLPWIAAQIRGTQSFSESHQHAFSQSQREWHHRVGVCARCDAQ